MDVAFLIRGRETSGELDLNLSERRGPRTTGDNSSSGKTKRPSYRTRGSRGLLRITRECNVT